MKNQGYSPQEIEKVKQTIQKTGNSFAYREKDTEEAVYANILFIGDYKGQAVVFDTFIYTLESEYMSVIFDDAREELLESHPEYANADFEALEGPHIDLLEEIANELAEAEDYSMQEFVEVDEEAEYGISLDVCLNVPEVNDEVIENFVQAYTKGEFKPDEGFYSFEME